MYSITKWKAILRLIRYQNLLVLFFTQLFIWACVVLPFGKWLKEPMFLSLSHFILLSLSTVLIAAAGYIINDYFDVKIDLINRPEKVIIEKVINRRLAIILHTLFNLMGLIIAFYLAYKLHHLRVFILQAFTTVLLWFYSTGFKRQFVIGNIVVAALTGLSVWALCLYEPMIYPYANLNLFVEKNALREVVNPYLVIGVYAYFAFMLTWMREIIKDMEDYKGDAEDGCVTMPIKIGLKRSAWIVNSLGVFALIPLFIAVYKFWPGHWRILGIYVTLLIIVPLVVLMVALPQKFTSNHYGFLSKCLKWIMISGICTLLVYYWLQYH